MVCLSTRRSWRVPATHVLISATVMSLFMHGANAQGNCLSLQSSEACPAFGAYYVSLTTVQQYTFFSQVTDLASFDLRMKAYSTFVNDQLDCNTSGVIEARYSMTVLCARMVQDTLRSLPCNFQHHVTPLPLCQSTCNTWVDSIRNNSDTSECSLATLAGGCVTWPGLSGVSGNCILGSENEPDTCGFQDHQDACAYCKTQTDTCCQTLVPCDTALSGGVIAGIVVGSVAGLGLIVFAGLMMYRHRRLRRQPRPLKTFTRGHRREPSQEALMSLQDLSPPIEAYSPPTAFDNVPMPLSFTVVEGYYVVVHDYTPRHPDELQLVIGTTIFVKLAFDDGWAYGNPTDSSVCGVFPLFCVVPSNLLVKQTSQDKTLVEESLVDTEWSSGHDGTSIHLQGLHHTLPSCHTQAIPKRSVSMHWKKRYSSQKHLVRNPSEPQMPIASHATSHTGRSIQENILIHPSISPASPTNDH